MKGTRGTSSRTVGLVMVAAMAAMLDAVGCKSNQNPTDPTSQIAHGDAPETTKESTPANTGGSSTPNLLTRVQEPSEKPDPTSLPAATSSPAMPSSSPTVVVAVREVFPSVRVDVAGKIIEFDGVVPIDVHDPKSPRVYLEVIACTFDSKEHESLVATRAKPSHVHAALLMIGLEPGAPGSWTIDEQSRVVTVPPRGSEVSVALIFNPKSPDAKEVDPADLVISAKTKARASSLAGAGFVFGGSRIVEWQGQSLYDADGTGTLIGLATFGSETIAWREVFSPEAAIAEPMWIADNERIPAAGTAVAVRLRPAGTK